MTNLLRMNAPLLSGVKKWNGHVKKITMYTMVLNTVLEIWYFFINVIIQSSTMRIFVKRISIFLLTRMMNRSKVVT